MAVVPTSQAISTIVERSLTSLESAETMIESIRFEVNRYWERMHIMSAVAASADTRVLEKDMDSLLDGHDKLINTFYRSVSQMQPVARNTQLVEDAYTTYTKFNEAKKRNRARQAELLSSLADGIEDSTILAVDFPRRKRPKRATIPPDLMTIERALSDWIKQTNGEFQILSKLGQTVIGRHTGPATAVESVLIPQPSIIPSSHTSQVGARSNSIVRSMTYAAGQYEVKVTIKTVIAFSFIVEASETDSCGQACKIACSNISEASTTNVWVSNPSVATNTMKALTKLLSLWVEDRKPTVPVLLNYLATFTDLFKTICCSCNKWIAEDGSWGLLPPLCNVAGHTANARKHFCCAPL